jgi:hypothetical protein
MCVCVLFVYVCTHVYMLHTCVCACVNISPYVCMWCVYPNAATVFCFIYLSLSAHIDAPSAVFARTSFALSSSSSSWLYLSVCVCARRCSVRLFALRARFWPHHRMRTGGELWEGGIENREGDVCGGDRERRPPFCVCVCALSLSLYVCECVCVCVCVCVCA